MAMSLDFNSLADTRTPRFHARSRDEAIAGIAHHEAGHAVVGMTFGMSLAHTRVHTVDVDGCMGWTGSTRWNISWVNCFNLAIELAAGEAAEKQHLTGIGINPVVAARMAASPHDRDMAVEALAKSNYTLALEGPGPADPNAGTTWGKVTAAAAETVDRLWQQIATVSEALLATPRRELTGAEVAALTGIPNPTPSAPAS